MIKRNYLFALLAMAIGAGQYTKAQSWDEVGLVQADPLFSEEYIGYSVAIDGETAVGGSPYSDGWLNGQTLSTNSGIAHIIKKFNGNWTTVFTINPSDPAGNKNFGHSVDISDTKVIVGAPGDATNGTTAGAAYIFELNGSTLTETKLLPSISNAGGRFGYSVAIDGNFAVVGMPFHDTYTTGAAYVFEKIGSTWTEVAILVASDSVAMGASNLGRDVAIDGNRIVVGDSYNDNEGVSNSGALYVYEYDGTTWTETAKLGVTPTLQSFFLGPVSLSGDRIIAGRRGDAGFSFPGDVGDAYIFEYDGTDWTQAADLHETPIDGLNYRFGSAVDIDGDRAIVGTLPIQQVGGTPNGQGIAFLYERINSNWVKVDSIQASMGNSNDNFGISVGISGDLAIAGGSRIDNNGSNPNSGAIGIFGRTCPVDIATTQNGMSITADNASATAYQWINCDGDTLLPGETGQTFTATVDGDYAVIITDGVCVDTSVCVTVSSIGLDELNSDNLIVYPNPSSDGHFKIVTEQTIERIELLDMSGRQVNFNLSSDNKEVDASHLERGTYLLYVVTQHGYLTKSISILR